MLFEFVTEWATWGIREGGPLGAGILMALESMIAPVPSEAVMPYVGYVVADGKMNLGMAIFATSLGSLIGSLISYWLGYVGGKPLVMKVGKYMLLNEHHLDMTVAWFHKRGGLTVFVSRFIPVVRHLISIPAGIGKMPLLPFCLYTVVGATMWNGFLLWLGYYLKQNWEVVQKYSHVVDVVFIGGCVVAAAAWWVLHRKKTSKEPAGASK